MENEINRYTLNAVVDGFNLPIAHSTLENIDHFSTNFESQKQLIDFIKAYFKIDYSIENISITYHFNKQLRKTDIILRRHSAIIDDPQLINKMMLYLEKNVNTLNLDGIENNFLLNSLKKLKVQIMVNDRNFTLNKIKNNLIEEYRLKRDCALYLESYMQRHDRNLLTPPVEDKPDMDEVQISLNQMDMLIKPNMYAKPEMIEKQVIPVEVNNSHSHPLTYTEKEIAEIYDDEELRPPYSGVTFYSTSDTYNSNEEKGKSR